MTVINVSNRKTTDLLFTHVWERAKKTDKHKRSYKKTLQDLRLWSYKISGNQYEQHKKISFSQQQKLSRSFVRVTLKVFNNVRKIKVTWMSANLHHPHNDETLMIFKCNNGLP